jgi:adenylate kinase
MRKDIMGVQGQRQRCPGQTARRRSVAGGELVSDDLVEKVVRRRLDEHDWNYGFIVDGFPRNQPQARFFLESYDPEVDADQPAAEVQAGIRKRLGV